MENIKIMTTQGKHEFVGEHCSEMETNDWRYHKTREGAILQFMKNNIVSIQSWPYVEEEDTTPPEVNEPVYAHDGLMWTKTFHEMTWKDAVEFCDDLHYAENSDWRLPTVKELFSIVDQEKNTPACHFGDCAPEDYWSATLFAKSKGFAWFIGFRDGIADYDNKTIKRRFRAVRNIYSRNAPVN